MIDGAPDSTIALLSFIAATGWGALGWLGRLYFKGGLHPQATIDRMVAEHEREIGDLIHDRDEWRAESRIKDAQLAERDRQLQVLAVIGDTTKATLSAVLKAVGVPARDLPGAEHQEPAP